MAPTRPTTQIYLVIEAGPTASVRLAAVLAGTHGVTALLIRPGAAPLDATAARPLVEQAQKSNVAALIEGDPALARALRADGVHLPENGLSPAQIRRISGSLWIGRSVLYGWL